MNTSFSMAQPSEQNIETFMSDLEQIRAAQEPQGWKQFTEKNKELRAWKFFLSHDPYTRWGLMKPRGYAGDATLMDFAYGHHSILDELKNSSPLGQLIYRHTSKAKQSESARQRVQLLTEKLTQTAATTAQPRALSFAAGHARELEALPQAIKQKFACFTAIDNDPKSLEEAQKSAGSMRFQALQANVLRAPLHHLEPGHLVYSLGLFDYLNTDFARHVTERMWQATAPGGTMIIANLADDAANLGYCEAVMDWWMIPRSIDDMFALGDCLVERGMVHRQVHRVGCFYYLEATKASQKDHV